ncbi:hypothetical protein VNI00_011051 [Paramarasmius palmivorus]|uniref:Uncharacterized protein n=1 Tax=Paramarasmius palmivorus TaxID=297713 RepID=A0AAW0CFQ3_9AGAR
MIDNYDVEGAKVCLDNWFVTRNAAEHSKPNVSQVVEGTLQMDTIHGGIPCAWRMVTNLEEPEELVFKIQGVASFIDLPPFTKYPGKRARAGFLRQGLTITGFGSGEFQKAVDGIKIVDHVLKRNVPVPDAEPLACFGEIDGATTLHISNRFFSPRRLVEGEAAVNFAQDVDPYDILRKLAGSDFVHTKENVVTYERIKSIVDHDDIKFDPASPAVFRTGDVVEVQFTMMLVPIGKGGRPPYKTFPVLRSITLLEDTFSQKAAVQSIVGPKARITLKRDAGNWKETEETTAKQMRKMKI